MRTLGFILTITFVLTKCQEQVSTEGGLQATTEDELQATTEEGLQDFTATTTDSTASKPFQPETLSEASREVTTEEPIPLTTTEHVETLDIFHFLLNPHEVNPIFKIKFDTSAHENQKQKREDVGSKYSNLEPTDKNADAQQSETEQPKISEPEQTDKEENENPKSFWSGFGDAFFDIENKAKSYFPAIFETLKQTSENLSSLYEPFDPFPHLKDQTLNPPSELLPSLYQPPPKPKVRKRETRCGPECTEEGYFRLNKSCTKFYQCAFDPKCNKLVSKIRTCPKCLKFNAQKNICDLATNVPECSYLQTTPKDFCTGEGKFFVPDDCSRFYDCEKSPNGTVLTVRTCPEDTVFSQKDQTCVKRRTCDRHVPKCGAGKFYLEDKFDCNSFYYCVNANQSAPLACPPNSIFDGQMCEIWEKSKLHWEKVKKRLGRKYK